MQKNTRWISVLIFFVLHARLWADSLLTAGITSIGTNAYPYTNKPAAGSQINGSRTLAAGLVSALPVNEGVGTNFYDAVPQQSYQPRLLSGSPAGATPPAWFTPVMSPDYPWSGPAISNNNTNAQAIQSAFTELSLINNVTNGYSYAELVEPLDTNSFGRIMDGTGAAVIVTYLNIPGNPGKVATTWRDSNNIAIVPMVSFTPNKWMLVLCTVQQGLGVMYINGVPAVSNANVNLVHSWANQTGQPCYNSTGNGSSMPNANFSSWWVWNNRVLSVQEAAQFYANPWSMFHSGSQKGFVKGTELTLANPASVSNVWFYSHSAAGNIRLGIYDNNSPKNLLWQSGSISNAAAGGWVAAPIAAGVPEALALAPGTYWLAWQVDSTYDVPSYAPGANGDGFFLSQAFGNFPAAVADAQSSSETWSIYLDYARPSAPFFTNASFQPPGTLQLQLVGSTNIPFGLQVSTDMVSWLPLNTPGFVSNGLWFYHDTNIGAFPRRFYRAEWP